jgi:hypothetical protein
MKQKFAILSFIIFCIISSVSAQPQKKSWSIGGSGYWVKMRSHGENKLTRFDYSLNGQYFLFRHFALGAEIDYRGGRALDLAGKPRYHELYFSPVIEGYLINNKNFGISLKGLASLNASIKSNFDPEKLVSFYMFGPKLSYNITPNFSIYSWFTYRKLSDEGTNNYPGRTVIFPSDNNDIRFGFSYYFHPKK